MRVLGFPAAGDPPMSKRKYEIFEQTLTRMRDAENLGEFTARDVSKRAQDYSSRTISNMLKFTRGISTTPNEKPHLKACVTYTFVPGAAIEVEH
jgi:hypothetical protein